MLKLGGSTKLIIGYDLSDDFSQISYCAAGTDTVETLSSVAGGENYRIPTVLCKKQGVNQWFYGNEALKNESEQGILIRNLLTLAVDGEIVLVEGKEFDPVALLTLFVKRSLGLLSQLGDGVKPDTLVFTCRSMQPEVQSVLERVVEGLKFKAEKVFYISHTESYYYYMLYQPEELLQFKSVLFDYHRAENSLRFYELEGNKRTTPVTVFANERDFELQYAMPLAAQEELTDLEKEQLDEQFLALSRQLCINQMISSVFLIGEGFGGEWMQESLRYLCKGRRVFQGNNLFSKGACYFLLERVNPSEAGLRNVLLGQDNLRANIGMNIYRQGEESYMALLDAGSKWYEATAGLEFYLQDGREVELLISPLMERKGRLVRFTLDELPGDISRLRMELRFTTERTLSVRLEDLGFGDLRPASGRVWQEEIDIYQEK